MTDNDNIDTFGLSRRKLLAGLGAVGVASAGAGLGTTAYFNDTETFEGNTLTAGELDLKVDWQQTYNGPIPGGDGVGEHPVNAYPDTPLDGEGYGDGLQDLNGVRYSGAGETEPVFNAAEVPACCDCEDDEYYVTYGGESYCIEPLSGDDPQDAYEQIGVRSEQTDFQDESRSTVFLWEDDDDGNVYLFIVNDRIDTETGGTATYRIEGAPAMRWLSSDWLVQDDDPSSDDSYVDPDTSNPVAVGNWIWNGANTDGGVIGPVNNNGSQGEFALRITPELNEMAALHEDNAGSYPGWFEGDNWAPLTSLTLLDGAADNVITLADEIDESGDDVDEITIHSSCGIDSGAELDTPAVFRSESYPGQEHLVELDDVKPGDTGEITFSLHLCDNPGYVWFTAGNFSQDGGTLTEPETVAMGDDESDEGELADHVDVTLWYDSDCDNTYGDDETPIFEGTLAGLMNELGVESNVDEGDDDFTGMLQLDADPDTAESIECFPAGEGFCVGFEWEVPTTVGNVIQGDSVVFDLGFYTEQCRHNDGTGSEQTV